MQLNYVNKLCEHGEQTHATTSTTGSRTLLSPQEHYWEEFTPSPPPSNDPSVGNAHHDFSTMEYTCS